MCKQAAQEKEKCDGGDEEKKGRGREGISMLVVDGTTGVPTVHKVRGSVVIIFSQEATVSPYEFLEAAVQPLLKSHCPRITYRGKRYYWSCEQG